MFKKYEAFIGDILLYKPKDKKDFVGNTIGFFTNGGEYTHCSVYIGDGRIVESHINSGVVEILLQDKYHERIDVYRVKSGIDKYQKSKLVKYMREHEVGKGYDLAAFPSAFVRSSLAQVFGFNNFSKDRPLLNDDEHRFCSELVAASYFNALGIRLCPLINPVSVTPNDLGRSKELRRIS